MNTGNGYIKPHKKKIVALLLCLFGGYIGLHRFYVDKTISGLVYFFTGGLFLIGVIVDLISILTGGFKDAFGQPLI